MFDMVIHSGSIIDGSGSPAVSGALAITGDKITAMGDIPADRGKISIDATGQVVCPGFIDTHSHSDVVALEEPALLPKLMQGVTTDLLGQDGIGPAPLRADLAGPWKGYLSGLSGHGPDHWDWQSFDDYLDRLSSRSTGINLAALLPAGNVRMAVLGLDNVPADRRALAAMQQEVRAGMAAGALGMSLGMVYLPCTFFSMHELNAIYSVCADLGGFMVVHMRSSSNLLIESVAELLVLAGKAGVPLHLSHLKASGRPNWPKMSRVLEMIDEARAAGGEVTFDIYPYTAGSTMFSAVLPPWALEGGMDAALSRLANPEARKRMMAAMSEPTPSDKNAPGWDNHGFLNGWENIVISSARTSEGQHLVGKSVAEIAIERDAGPEETVLDILLEERGDVGMLVFTISEACLMQGLKHPAALVCTDGLLGGRPHPRVYGSFPRVLKWCAGGEKLLSLEEAIGKMTFMSARRLGLHDRGRLKPGFAADVVVFDPAKIEDTATYENPRQYPLGISHVLVNGTHAVRDGQFTGRHGGRVLRGS